MATESVVQRECTRLGLLLTSSAALIYGCRRLRDMNSLTKRWLRDRNLAYAGATGTILLYGGLRTREDYMHERAEEVLTEIRHEVAGNRTSRYFREAVWPSLVGKKLTGWHPPVGSILEHPDGTYRLDQIVTCWGGHASLFESETGDLPLVVYRGTTNFDLYTILEDFREEIGIPSWQMLQPEVRTWLKGRECDVIGFSLGGIHAQCHAVDIRNVRTLTTIASPRITPQRAQAQSYPGKSVHVVDIDDEIPNLGGGYLVGAYYPKRVVVWVLDEHGKSADEIRKRASIPRVADSFRAAVGDVFGSERSHRSVRSSRPHSHLRWAGEETRDFLARKPTTHEQWRRWFIRAT